LAEFSGQSGGKFRRLRKKSGALTNVNFLKAFGRKKKNFCVIAHISKIYFTLTHPTEEVGIGHMYCTYCTFEDRQACSTPDFDFMSFFKGC
jgi:hypothetical protein